MRKGARLRLFLLVVATWFTSHAMVHAKGAGLLEGEPAVDFYACESTRRLASSALSESLSVRITSSHEMTYEERVSGDDATEEEEYSIHATTSSAFDLAGIQYWTRGDQHCAGVAKSELKSQHAMDQKEVLAFHLRDLPEEPGQRHKKITRMVAKIDQVRAIGKLLGRQSKDRLLNAKEKKLLDALSEINLANVMFAVNVPDARIQIGSAFHEPAKAVVMRPGPYDYTIEAPGHCPLTASFRLLPQQSLEVEVDMSPQTLPTVAFQTNDAAKTRLKVNAKPAQFGPQPRPACSGTLSYEMIYDGNEDDARRGAVELAPGLVATIDEHFLTTDLRDRFFERNASYREAATVGILYSPAFPMAGHDTPVAIHNLRADFMAAAGMLRYGLGIGYGRGDTTNTFDGYARLALQLTHLGETQPIHFLEWFPIIPYLDLLIGLGYREVTDRDKDDFAKDHLLISNHLGVLIPVNSDFAVDFKVGHEWLMERTISIALGVVIRVF